MKNRIGWREFRPQITSLNLCVLSAALVTLVFVLQGNAGFNFWDEGFLWYGTIRTALGEIPIRDFQSYDPGRYYWGALWFKLLRNDGIMALRVSQAAFQFLGLTFALLLVRRVWQKWLPIIGVAALLLLWMFPPWKIYEPVITIAAIYFAVLLIEKPSRIRHFIVGVFVGLAAFFGRNHGLYCSVAFLVVIVFVWWRKDWRLLLERLVIFSLGGVIGYMPMLLMFVLVPGFFAAFVDGILFNIHNGTNLPLPVPWPWRIINYSHTRKEWLNRFGIGLTYLAFPAFYFFAFVGLLLKPKLRANNVLIACTCVGAVYLHYIFERPHLYYLAWTIPPFIIGLIALSSSFRAQHKLKLTVIIWALLLSLSLASAELAPENYFLVKALSRLHLDNGRGMVKTDIRGDTLWVTKEVADVVNTVNAINRQLIPANDSILVVPYWSGFYPILKKESPTWEIYCLFPQPLSEQERFVADLSRKQVNWALVCNTYLDNRPELAFRHTHNYVWRYLTANFEPVPIGQPTGDLRDCELLHRTNSTTDARLSDPAPLQTPAVGNSAGATSVSR
jgi:hypothetical protein